jgi:hypothetical protein
LRTRLNRGGATLTVSALAAGLAEEAAALAPASLMTSPVASGTSAAAARQLADGVLRTMFLTKALKLTAAVGLAGVMAAGAAWRPSAAADPPRPTGTGAPTGEVIKPAPKDLPKDPTRRLRELQAERIEALKVQLEGQFERTKVGKDPLIVLIDAIRELAEAELDIAETKEARMAAVEKMLRALMVCEQQLQELHQVGLQTKQGVAQAKAARLKAEIELEKLKATK